MCYIVHGYVLAFLIVLPVVVTVTVFLAFVGNGFWTSAVFTSPVLGAVLAFIHGDVFEMLFAFGMCADVMDTGVRAVFHNGSNLSFFCFIFFLKLHPFYWFFVFWKAVAMI